jgi:hypothetical protein
LTPVSEDCANEGKNEKREVLNMVRRPKGVGKKVGHIFIGHNSDISDIVVEMG